MCRPGRSGQSEKRASVAWEAKMRLMSWQAWDAVADGSQWETEKALFHGFSPGRRRRTAGRSDSHLGSVRAFWRSAVVVVEENSVPRRLLFVFRFCLFLFLCACVGGRLARLSHSRSARRTPAGLQGLLHAANSKSRRASNGRISSAALSVQQLAVMEQDEVQQFRWCGGRRCSAALQQPLHPLSIEMAPAGGWGLPASSVAVQSDT